METMAQEGIDVAVATGMWTAFCTPSGAFSLDTPSGCAGTCGPCGALGVPELRVLCVSVSGLFSQML